jgi:hypothetical protein
MDDASLTLAFDLEALRRVADPTAVVADAERWSEQVGVVTDRPPHVLTKFTREHAIQQAFSPEPEPAVETLEHMRRHFETARHVYVGTSSDHAQRAEAAGWEYLNVEEAARAADWELDTAPEPTGPNRVDTSTDDWP